MPWLRREPHAAVVAGVVAAAWPVVPSLLVVLVDGPVAVAAVAADSQYFGGLAEELGSHSRGKS